jgi:hypothetical protein
VRAVHVGIGHDDDLAVAQLGGVEIVFADARADGGDQAPNFLMAEHFVVARFFDVEDFTFEGQDGLEPAVATLFRGAAGGFAFD